MLQCTICEDWFHTRHLDAAVLPDTVEAEEMICGDCMTKNDFLKHYTRLMFDVASIVAGGNTNGGGIGGSGESGEDGDINIDGIDKPDDVLKDEMNQCVLDIINMKKEEEEPESTIAKEGLGKHKATSSNSPSTSSSSTSSSSEPPEKRTKIECTKPKLQVKNDDDDDNEKKDDGTDTAAKKSKTNIKVYEKGATFWMKNWRKCLCKCNDCLENYKTLNVEYLLDIEDTVHSYVEQGKKKNTETMYERGMKALSTLDRTQQVNVITGYNKMKDKLKDFLQTFVVNDQVVTVDDINQFFTSMTSDKSSENDSQQQQSYFCR